jgi:hypothetical protein
MTSQDNLLVFRAKGSAAVTADGQSSTVKVRGGTWLKRLWANFLIEAGSVASSTGTAKFKVQGTTDGGSSWVDVTPQITVDLTTTSTAAKQIFCLPVESRYVDYRIDVDVTGSTPSVTYAAALGVAPIQG